MSLSLKRLTAFSFCLLSMNAVAEVATIKSVSLSGNGCMPGSFSSVLSPDNSAVSILFDELSVEVPFEKQSDDFVYDSILKTKDRKTCNIVMKFDVPAGHKLRSLDFKTDFRGFAFGEEGTLGSLETRLISFKENRNHKKPMSTVIIDKKFGNFEFDEDIDESANVNVALQSNCGNHQPTEIEVVVRSHLTAEIIDTGALDLPMANLVLDSNDTSGQFKMQVNTQKCGGNGNGYGRGRGNDRGNGNGRGRSGRSGRSGRIDRSEIEQCRLMGGQWYPQYNRCLVLFGRGRR